ncbi:MAG: class I adenylate-forming enzyme family protein, partial [Gemmiger qucibialis]
MNENAMLTGKPSIDRPWMKFYPDVLRGIQVPACTVEQYLSVRAADPNVVAMHYYGVDITWGTVFRKVDATARALQVLGVKQGDQIPVFLRSVPEFIYLLLAAERIGASLLCRDNTLEENIEAVQKANAKVIFVHDFFSKAEIEAYREQTNVNTYVIVPALESGDRAAMPVYLQHSLDALYPDVPARGSDTMMWADFCNMGQRFRGFVPAPVNIDRPLLRAYTSGSTGPSKQVIHSAHSIIGVLAQMNFYGSSDKFRPTWLLTILPPALIAVVVSMMLLPLAGGMLLILDPFVDVYDVDLEMMRYRPNNWPLIPMFVEVIRRSKRLPADYDMSHMLAIGAGCEAFNNKQLRNVEEFLKQHNCNLRFTAGYGSSEAGSNATLPMAPFPVRDGNVGVPMIHSVISIFKPGTQEELTYNTPGEICMTGPGVMLGYDRPEATAKALQVHADGKTWLHTGDIGYMSEDGVLYTMTRGASPRFGGG